jgi:hypothetical protein
VRIAILHHARAREYARKRDYTTWELADIWREQGREVEAVFGVDNDLLAGFDVVIQHVDLTVVPLEYRYEGTGSQVVINARCYDISKNVVADLGIRSPDERDGPVIVKTALNHGGRPEADARAASRIVRGIRRLVRRTPLRYRFAVDLDPHNYPIFETTREVPRSVWSNPSLVVERFMPEREGDAYAMRWCLFLGDRATCFRFVSEKPIVKVTKSTMRPAPVPDDVAAMRERVGLDFGRFDFVVHDGKSHVLDVTRTPCWSHPDRRKAAEAIAPGLDALVGSTARGS